MQALWRKAVRVLSKIKIRDFPSRIFERNSNFGVIFQKKIDSLQPCKTTILRYTVYLNLSAMSVWA